MTVNAPAVRVEDDEVGCVVTATFVRAAVAVGVAAEPLEDPMTIGAFVFLTTVPDPDPDLDPLRSILVFPLPLPLELLLDLVGVGVGVCVAVGSIPHATAYLTISFAGVRLSKTHCGYAPIKLATAVLHEAFEQMSTGEPSKICLVASLLHVL